MQIIRTFVWVLLLVLLLGFSFFNWKPVEVQIWDNLVLETKVPALVIVSFLLGLIPMWLIHRGVRWRLERRIAGLELAARSAAVTPSAATVHDDRAVTAPPPAAQPLASEGPVEGAPKSRDDILK